MYLLHSLVEEKISDKSSRKEIRKMAEKLTGQDISFLTLPTAVFCVECELISKKNTPYCMACGSGAVLGLSRLLGGSLRGQPTAHLIADAELDRLVRELLRTVPSSLPAAENHLPASFASLAPGRHHVRCAAQSASRVGSTASGLQT